MKIGFITFAASGHFNPTSALARQLQSRNHDVVTFALAAMEPLASAAGLPFVPFGERELPVERLTEIFRTLSSLKGEEGLQFTIGAIAEAMKVKWKTLPKILSSRGIDAVVLDDCDFYGAIVPMHLGMPYAVLSNALHFDYSGYTPLCVCDWPHEITPGAIERNRQGVSKFTQMLIRSNSELIKQAEKTGMKANWEAPSSLYSDLPWITQCPREFDFESSHWPQQFHYAGPFHDGKGRMDFPFPWDRLTGQPIVYASMGTVQNGNADLFRTIAAAVSKRKDVQLVLSIGNLLRPEQIGPVPSNAIVVNNAPQLELLKEASVCITHAGLNTVLEALTQGVPQIAIPITNDQFGVAARIADKKTGIVTSFDGLDASNLSVLLDEAIDDPVYSDNSRLIQKAIAKKNGLSAAADLLEQAFGLTKKQSGSDGAAQ
jgi:zeaxanthin glucosyltransferase